MKKRTAGGMPGERKIVPMVLVALMGLAAAVAAGGPAGETSQAPAQTQASAQAPATLDTDALVETDRAFSRTAREKGMRAAFLQYVTVQGVVFLPKASNAREWYTKRDDLYGLLGWEPEVVEIARGGDLGYTTGAWEFRDKPSDTETAFGQYVTLWKKQLNGTWLVLIDVGSVRGRRAVGTAGPAAVKALRPVVPETVSIDVDTAKSSLMEADRAFSNLSSFKGAAEAYTRYAADDIRFYPRQSAGVAGLEPVRGALPAPQALLTWRPTSGLTADSGDLGFTYGMKELRADGPAGTPELFGYLRIWRRDAAGAWKVALEIDDPKPQPAARPAN